MNENRCEELAIIFLLQEGWNEKKIQGYLEIPLANVESVNRRGCGQGTDTMEETK